MDNILSDKLKKILGELGFNEFTDIQKLSIPRIYSGENLVIGAPTGYGKTLAAFLPFIDKIDANSGKLQLLYITPLRSLNRDIFKNIIQVCNRMGIEVDIRHGDTSARERTNQVASPPNCLITTPETIQSMFLSKRMVEHLKDVKYVIVDEVQSLMESKRGTQFSVGLERLRRITSFQIVGISATIADFAATKAFLGCNDSIEFRGEKEYNIKVLYPNIENEDEIIASKENVSEVVANSLRFIEEELKTSKSTLLFTNTRETAELLGSRLAKFLKDRKIEVHHSSLSKEVRTEIEDKFKVGDVDLMIATSSLELGIDIGNADLVIQYMSPRQVIKLIQRIGRSNHNRTGIAEGRIVTINVDDYLESIAIKESMESGRLETISLPMGSLDVLSHQIVGLIIDGVGKPSDIFNIIKKSYAYKDTTRKSFDAVLDFMIKHYFIRYYGEVLIRTRKGLLFYISNISTIPDRKTFVVIDSQLNKKIGVLDEGFVAENGKEGNTFIIRGESWKILSIEGQKISVIRSSSSIGAIPAWEGELMPVHRFISETAANIRRKYIDKFSTLKEQRDNFILPDSENILIERVEDYIIIHAPFGNRLNEGLSKALSSVIASAVGESVISKIDPYRVMIKTNLPLEEIRKLLFSMEDAESLIRENIRLSSLYEYRFLNIAKRFGVVSKYADFTKMHLRTLVDLYKGSVIEEETFNEVFRDKIDIQGVLDVLDKIKKKKISVHLNDGDPSPLAYEGIESSYGGSLIKPAEARKLLRELVVNRLNETKLFLQCLNCSSDIGEFSSENTDGLKCRKCGAKYIGFYKTKYRDEYRPLIKKWIKGKKLSKEEEKTMNRIKQSGTLYLAYGGKACFVGSSYGIGPQTAGRILASYSNSKDQLVDKIIEAEKNYIETREYWG
ncbi:MAG: DEAD/DEAH box helicase [Candidatus Parvarchaeota archaeon]|nr:DEAD/DEAH box helicase [Candidatus Parvarchaeota archaeon]